MNHMQKHKTDLISREEQKRILGGKTNNDADLAVNNTFNYEIGDYPLPAKEQKKKE